jgi:hypothetical protein
MTGGVLRRLRWVALAALPILLIGLSGAGNSASGKPEKHQSVASAPPVRLPVVFKTRGPNDPHDFDLSFLIPRRTRLRQVWFIRGGRQPDQVLVEWIRSGRISLYETDFPDTVRWGLTLWTQTPRRVDYQGPWKGVAIQLLKVAPGAPNLRVALADVTSDGHPDVLVEQYPHTNHGCGPHQVVSTMRDGSTWPAFRRWMCEIDLRGRKGLLALDLPYYLRGDSVCCWSKVEKVRLRWNGRRFVKVSDRIIRR